MAKAMPKYPELAAALRAYIDRHKISIAELNTRIGVPKHNTNTYNWVKGTGIPRAETQHKIATLLNADPAKLFHYAEGKSLIVMPQTQATTRPRTNVLTYVIHNDGTARIAFDLTLPHDQATPLLRMLLDASIVFQPPNS